MRSGDCRTHARKAPHPRSWWKERDQGLTLHFPIAGHGGEAMKAPPARNIGHEQKSIPPLSQSRQGDMACETLYVHKHVQCERIVESEVAERGEEVHEILATYLYEPPGQNQSFDEPRSIRRLGEGLQRRGTKLWSFALCGIHPYRCQGANLTVLFVRRSTSPGYPGLFPQYLCTRFPCPRRVGHKPPYQKLQRPRLRA